MLVDVGLVFGGSLLLLSSAMYHVARTPRDERKRKMQETLSPAKPQWRVPIGTLPPNLGRLEFDRDSLPPHIVIEDRKELPSAVNSSRTDTTEANTIVKSDDVLDDLEIVDEPVALRSRHDRSDRAMSRGKRIGFTAGAICSLMLGLTFLWYSGIGKFFNSPASATPFAVESPSDEHGGVWIEGHSPGREYLVRNIEDIRPGMRVLADNPEHEEASKGIQINPSEWRMISLEMTKPDGGTLNIELLRPAEWLDLEAIALILESDDPMICHPRPLVCPVQDAAWYDVLLGREIPLDMPELGAQGLAIVTGIALCPEIEAANSPRQRLVTATFRHSSAEILDVSVSGMSESIGVTATHPFWSVREQAFVPIGDMRVGDQVQRADGTAAYITRITPRRGPPQPVYNIEVEGLHTYHVGEDGVLVHNTCVYFSKNANGYEYFGITDHWRARRAFHARNGRSVTQIRGLTNLTRYQAREVEQALIWFYGRASRAKGPLSNIRNSISPRHAHQWTAILNGLDRLKKAGWTW